MTTVVRLHSVPGERGEQGGTLMRQRRGARWLLRRVEEAASAGRPEALTKLVQRHPDATWRLYDDVFCIVSRAYDAEPLLCQLMRMDPTADDAWMARVHVRFLRSLQPSSPVSRCVQTVGVICQHYARHGKLKAFLEVNGSLENNQDPEFRVNCTNFLIIPMKRVIKENLNEDFAAQIIKTYIIYGIDVNSRYKVDGGESAVHFAAYNNLWRCVEVLLANKANVDQVFKGSTTRQIIRNRMMDQLLQKFEYCEISPTDQNDVTVVMFNALYDGDEERFQNIYLATLTQQGKYSDDDWNLICKLAPMEYVTQFINGSPVHHETKTASLTFSMDDGWNTLLQLASTQNLPGAVQTLLEIDPDPDKVSALKDPAVLLAAENGCFEIVLQLVSHKMEDVDQHAYNTVDVGVSGDFGDNLVHKMARAWTDLTTDDIEKARSSIVTIEKILNIILKRGELDINAENRKQETPLMIAMRACNKLLFNLLLKKGAFLGVSKEIMHEIREEDLEEMLNSTLSTEMFKGDRFVNIDFECLYLQYETPTVPDFNVYPEMLPLFKISQSKKHKNILSHPLITSFLDLKWFKFYSIYFANLLFYLLFVISLTCHVSFETVGDKERAQVSKIFTAMGCVYLLSREMLQFFMSYREYYKSFENWMEIFIILATVYFLEHGMNESLTFLILAAYAEFSLLLGRHPKVATYIAMFLRVSKVNILLLALSSPIIFAFSTCFMVLLRSDNENPYFHNTTSSLFKTVVMITGEFELGEIKFEGNRVLSKITFIMFVLSITIILMNLLNALAVNDTEAIQRDAEIISLQAKVELFTKIESALLGYPMSWYVNSWGKISDSAILSFFFHIRVKFRMLLNGISVLPLSENVSFLLSVREDGKIMEKVISTNTGKPIMRDNKIFNDQSKTRFTKFISKNVLGVHMRKIFEHSYYYAKVIERNTSKAHITDDMKSLQETLTAMQETATAHVKDIKVLNRSNSQQATTIYKIAAELEVLKQTTNSQQEMMEEMKKNMDAQMQNLTQELQKLNQQISFIAESRTEK